MKILFSSAKACPLVSRPRVNILEVPDLDTKEEPKVQVQLDKKPLKEKKRKSEGFDICHTSYLWSVMWRVSSYVIEILVTLPSMTSNAIFDQ